MKEPQIAKPQERFFAFLIDIVILVLLGFILSPIAFPGVQGGLYGGDLLSFRNFVSNLIVWAYNIIFLLYWQATPGKKLMGLKVTSVQGQELTNAQIVLRETVGKLASAIVFGLGYFWILIDKKRQGWHDRIASTLVVKTTN